MTKHERETAFMMRRLLTPLRKFSKHACMPARPVAISLDDEWRERLDATAKRERRTRSEVVREALRRYLDNTTYIETVKIAAGTGNSPTSAMRAKAASTTISRRSHNAAGGRSRD